MKVHELLVVLQDFSYGSEVVIRVGQTDLAIDGIVEDEIGGPVVIYPDGPNGGNRG